MSLRLKLFVGLGIVLGSSLAFFLYASWQAAEIRHKNWQLRNVDYPGLDKASKLQTLVRETRESFIHAVDEMDADLLEEVDKRAPVFDSLANEILKIDNNETIHQLQTQYRDYVTVTTKLVRDYLEGDKKIVSRLAEANHAATQLNQQIQAYSDSKYQNFIGVMEVLNRNGFRFVNMLMLMGVGLMGVLLSLGYALVVIIKQIEKLSISASTLASGKLNESIEVNRVDELGVLQDSFEKMRINLKNHIGQLDSMVENRTRQLQRAQKETEDILGSIQEGIFTVNPDASVNEKHSIKAKELFNTSVFKGVSLATLFGADERKMLLLDKWLKMMSSGKRFLKNWKSFVPLNPFNELVIWEGGVQKILKLDWQPIEDEGALSKIMVLAADITETKRYEKQLNELKQAQQLYMQRVLACAEADKEDLDNFLEQCDKLVIEANNIQLQSDLSTRTKSLFRSMHTLKGNAGTLGFSRVSERAATCEDVLSIVRESSQSVDVSTWEASIKALGKELEAIRQVRESVFGESRGKMLIDKQAMRRLTDEILTQPFWDNEIILDRLALLDTAPFHVFSRKYQRLVETYGQRSGKKIGELVIGNPNLQVPREQLLQVDSCLIHLLRNALDHGLETDDVRASLQKGLGRLELKAQINGGELQISVKDDGKGIDGDTVAQRALQLGLIDELTFNSLDQKGKENLVFLAGFTSRKDVNEFSGRGLGLDVVREQVKAMGWRMEMLTALGKGTEFRLFIPLRQTSGKT